MTLTLLTITDVAAQFQVAPRTINHWVQNGAFPSPVRQGKKPFWRPQDIADHVAALRSRDPMPTNLPAKKTSRRAAQNSAELQAMMNARRADTLNARSHRYPRG